MADRKGKHPIVAFHEALQAHRSGTTDGEEVHDDRFGDVNLKEWVAHPEKYVTGGGKPDEAPKKLLHVRADGGGKFHLSALIAVPPRPGPVRAPVPARARLPMAAFGVFGLRLGCARRAVMWF